MTDCLKIDIGYYASNIWIHTGVEMSMNINTSIDTNSRFQVISCNSTWSIFHPYPFPFPIPFPVNRDANLSLGMLWCRYKQPTRRICCIIVRYESKLRIWNNFPAKRHSTSYDTTCFLGHGQTTNTFFTTVVYAQVLIKPTSSNNLCTQIYIHMVLVAVVL